MSRVVATGQGVRESVIITYINNRAVYQHRPSVVRFLRFKMPAIKRIAFTVDEKVALRKQHAQNPELSQKALCKWFEESFSKPIRQGTVSEVLSTRYSHLDQQITPSQAASKKQRMQAYPALETALSQWLLAQGATPVVSGEVLKAKARFFWHQIPQYQDQQEPSFSDGWLARFKHRHGISLKPLPKPNASAAAQPSALDHEIFSAFAVVPLPFPRLCGNPTSCSRPLHYVASNHHVYHV